MAGASTGIGRSIAAGLAKRGWGVLGCARRSAPEPPATFEYMSVDLSTDSGAARVAEVSGPIDLLVVSVGVYGPGGAAYDPSRPVQSVGTLTREAAVDVYAQNFVAPLLTIQALLPRLRPDGAARVVLIGTRVASFGTRAEAGDLYYAPSKAAAHMLMRSLATLDPLPASFVVVDPGWVRSAAGGSFAPDEPEAASVRLLTFFERLGQAHNGGFYDRDGHAIPW